MKRNPLRTGDTILLRYLRHGEPVPEGAKLAHDLQDTHHGAHAVLVELPCDTEAPDED